MADPREEGLFLLGWLLDRSRGSMLLAQEEIVDAATVDRFDSWVRRRAAREPAQHISGEQEFYGLRFQVSPAVLIPRPETEMLVDAVIEQAPENSLVVDLGTGSGCIPVASAVTRKDLTFRAVDASAEALELARLNAQRHRVTERISFTQTDFAALPAEWNGSAAAVVSNPPYVREDDWARLEPEVRDHDPKRALVSGPTGLEAYRVVIPAAERLLGPGGYLWLEIGAEQAAEVKEILDEHRFRNVKVSWDLNGIERRLQARRGG